MRSIPGEIEKNLDRTGSFVSEASEKGVDIICFPELSISGYVLKSPQGLYPDSICQAIVERVVEMARTRGMVIITGFVETVEGKRPFISQIVAGPKGLLGIYRKTHLSPPEKKIYQAGQQGGLFHCRGVTFGILLCYETHFPEISTSLALEGAEIIFMPHASPRGDPQEKLESWLRHLPGRAFDNSLYVVACNQVGETLEGLSFPGLALILNPAGRVIASYRDNIEGILIKDLDGDELHEIRTHRMKYFLPNRRPELYTELCSPSGKGSRKMKRAQKELRASLCALLPIKGDFPV